MSTQPILIDSNVIIYALNSSSPKHLTAQDFLQTHRARLTLAHQNIFESLRVLTHARFPHCMTTQQALLAVNTITEACQLIVPDYTAHRLAMALIEQHDLSGNKIFDAYLAATALAAGITTIATDNVRDFHCFAGFTVINPFESI